MKNKIIFGIVSVAILSFTLLMATFSVDSPTASVWNFYIILIIGFIPIFVLWFFLFSKNKKIKKISKYLLIALACAVAGLFIFGQVIGMYYTTQFNYGSNSESNSIRVTMYNPDGSVVDDVLVKIIDQIDIRPINVTEYKNSKGETGGFFVESTNMEIKDAPAYLFDKDGNRIATDSFFNKSEDRQIFSSKLSDISSNFPIKKDYNF